MSKAVKVLIYLFFIVGFVLALFPFYWVFALATHNTTEIITGFPLLPGAHLLENLVSIFTKGTFLQGLLNSCFISVTSTVLAVFFSTACGFAFAKYRFKGRDTLFKIVLATMMIPMQIGLVAFVKMMTTFHLYNTYVPLVVQLGTAFGVFWMCQYIRSYVPDEMLEASRMEGLGEVGILLRIVIPVITPAIVSFGIIYFVNNWNAYLMPLILLQDSSKFTLPMVIAALQSRKEIDLGARYTALAMATLPLLILYLSLSGTVRESIAAGAIKG